MKNLIAFNYYLPPARPKKSMAFAVAGISALYLLCAGTLQAQVPNFIEHDGQLSGTNAAFTGTGRFKFALVNVGPPALAYWQNDNNSASLATSGAPIAEPLASVALTVSGGVYALYLGESGTLGIPYTVFSHSGLAVRTWFSRTGAAGTFVLQPDVVIPAVGYAMVIPDGAITGAKLASNAVTSTKISNGAVTTAKIASGAVSTSNLAPHSLDYNHLAVPTAPGAGQVLGFNGSSLNWTTPGSGGGGVFSLNGTSAYYNGGNVGIGTTTPANKLTVFASGYGFEHTDGTIRLGSSVNGNAGGFGTISNHPLNLFVNNGQPSLSIDTGGAVTMSTVGGPGSVTVGTPNAETGRWTSNGWGGAMELTNGEAIGWQTNGAGQRFGMGHTNGLFAVFRTASDPGTTASPATYDFAISDAGNVGVGTISPAAKLDVNGTTRTKGLTITGGADVAEPFQIREKELEKGSVVVIDKEHPGRLKRSTLAYDKRVAGIVSGANGINPGIALEQEGAIEGGQNVALSGRVYVQADATNGAIEPGDMLTTSNIPGRAMKVGDQAKAQGAVIGKAMSSLNEGTGMVLVLVSLQ